MAGAHDVGGKSGYGAPNLKPVSGIAGSAFAARWEAAVFAMMRCLGGTGVMKNTDQFRHAVERVDPKAYFEHGYYGRWLGGLETLLVEAHELDQTVLDQRVGALARELGATQSHIDSLIAESSVAARPLSADRADRVIPSANAGSSVRFVSQPPKFVVGDHVTARGYSDLGSDAGHQGHTRLPDYAKGCRGVITGWHRGWVLPDSNAHSGDEKPAHLYCVAFEASALFGAKAERGVVVHLDLFEPYLVPDRKPDCD